MIDELPKIPCPFPGKGAYAPGYERVARVFAEHLRAGEEIGAGLSVYHRGRLVVDVWGGLADRDKATPWLHDTRVVLFSVTKGLAAMAFAMLSDRGRFEWDAPVATYWPGFAQAGKAAITVRTLLNHEAGLLAFDAPLSLADVLDPGSREKAVRAVERQRPLWEPGKGQGYHAVTFGVYVRELFERIAKEPLGEFLRRELFAPLEADVSLGTGPEIDPRMATIYPYPVPKRLVKMVGSVIVGGTTEDRVMRDLVSRGSWTRRAFTSPRGVSIEAFDSIPVRRSDFASGAATGTAHGVARAYLPFSLGGSVGATRVVAPSTLAPIHARQGFSERDLVLQKPLGWSQGFLKEETSVFSPTRESFGHAGMGGALGWCDPVKKLAIGYVMNRLDWRVRSPRAMALCRALYDTEGVREAS
jgi:CubicO group peptidase (beta-lactamase class C family)